MRCSMEKVSVITWMVLILFCSNSVQPYRWDGNTLYDLEGEGSDFLAQAMNWTAVTLKDTLNSSNRVTNCNGSDILGGYNILATGKGKYWEKNLTDLPSHNQISFYMDFFPVDSWDKAGGDHFEMQFDSNITEGWILDVYGGAWSHAICGSTVWLDVDPIKTYVILPHNSSTLNFRVISQLDEATDNESFGFRNISFVFETVDTPTNDLCGSTVFPLPNNWCPCPFTHEYMYPTQSGTCYECDDSCVTCSGPNSNQCLSCETENGLYLSSGSCLPCASNCATCTGGAYNQCITCHNGDYLVGNNTCVPICPEPFYPTTNNVIDFCETPCPSKFAYKNGACSSTCSDPFEAYVLSVLKACVCFSSGAIDSDPCYSCDVSCVTCNGTAANDCLTCFEGFYLENEPGLETGTCEPCDSTCATCYGGAANQCNSCFSDAFLVLDGSVNNGTCGNCDPSCLTCDGSTNTTCLSCPDHFYLDLNPSPAVDGACLSCDPTCATCTGSADNECVTCYSGDYLVTNNTCITECNSPFFSTSDGTIDFCDTPCLGQYAFPNQTCTDACPVTTLYQTEETAVVLRACICTGYLYNNGSCLASCKSPMTIREENGQKYCDFNCPSGQYLNYDGTCTTDCGLPSIPRVEGDDLFCDYGGCDNVDITHIKHTPTGHEYQIVFVPDTSCNPAASLIQDILNSNEDFKVLLSDPQFIVTLKNKVYDVQLNLAASVLNNLQVTVALIGLNGVMPIPKKLVASALAQNLTNIATTAATAMGCIIGSNILTSLSLQNTASAWGFVGFQQFITFFKYANIDYPLQLEFFFILGGATDFSSAPNLLEQATASQYTQVEDNDDLMDEQTPPDKFFYYDATSFFIQNGGATFLWNWVALAIVFVILLVKKIPLLKKSKAYKYVELADDKLRWNFVIRSFLSTGLPQSISIFLQLRVLSNQETYLSLSTAFTIIALLHYIGMCVFIFYILHKTNFEDMKKKEIEKRYSTLVEGIEVNSNYAKYYHVLILLRGVTLAIMVVFADKIALFQVIIMIVFNVGLVYFLFRKVEFEERREMIKTRITEALIILMEICFTLLTRDVGNESYYNIIGWTTFGLIGAMFLNELIFALTSQVIGVKETLKTAKEKYSEWKKKKAEKKMTAKVAPIQPEEQAEFLTIEPRSGMMSPNASASPTGHNNLLEPRLSLKDFSQSVAKDVTPKDSVREKGNFGRTVKIHPAPISPMGRNGLSEDELFFGERSPISMSLETRGPRETDAFWLKPITPDSRKRQVFPESAAENIEEVTLLETEKKL